MEYYEATFRFADSAYGSTFFIATGFHGLHVIVDPFTLFFEICTKHWAGYEYSIMAAVVQFPFQFPFLCSHSLAAVSYLLADTSRCVLDEISQSRNNILQLLSVAIE